MRYCFYFTLSLSLAVSSYAKANSNEQFNSTLRFNFNNPGAAQLGLAGAFTAKADDASAAIANPAGLIRTDRQTLVEWRRFGFDTSFISGGQLSIDFPDFAQNGRIIDDRPVLGQAKSNTQGISFAGYADSDVETGWGWALYYANLANFESNFSTQRATLSFLFDGEPIGSGPLNASTQSGNFEVNGLGAAVAKGIGNWSFGLGVQRQELEFGTTNVNAGISSRNAVFQQSDDSDWAFSLSAMWRAPNNRWGAGLQYRSGASFATAATANQFRIADGVQTVARSFRFEIKTPSQVNFGAFFKPNENWTLLADIAHIRYSRLSTTQDIFSLGTSPVLELPSAKDGLEYRLGAEYFMTVRERPLFVRFGLWSEPDASLAFRGLPNTQLVLTTQNTPGVIRPNELNDYFLFRRGERELHKTFGIGYVWPKVQVDLAYDHSTPVKTGSISLLIPF